MKQGCSDTWKSQLLAENKHLPKGWIPKTVQIYYRACLIFFLQYTLDSVKDNCIPSRKTVAPVILLDATCYRNQVNFNSANPVGSTSIFLHTDIISSWHTSSLTVLSLWSNSLGRTLTMGLRLNTLPPNSLLVKINIKNILENIFVYDRIHNIMLTFLTTIS